MLLTVVVRVVRTLFDRRRPVPPARALISIAALRIRRPPFNGPARKYARCFHLLLQDKLYFMLDCNAGGHCKTCPQIAGLVSRIAAENGHKPPGHKPPGISPFDKSCADRSPYCIFISVADPAMGGQGGRPPPIDQNLGLVMAARLRHGGKFSLKSLTFGHFFV